MQNSKTNTILLIVLIILVLGIGVVLINRNPNKTEVPVDTVTKTDDVVSETEGNKEDLVSFSIKPGQEVSGEMTVTGVLKGAYFFEGSFPISILDSNKISTPFGGYATATTDWMTAGPVSFTTYFDFNKMPKGNHYIGLFQDDPSGGESGKPIRKVLIPIVIK